MCTGVYVNLMGRCSTSQQHCGPGPGCGCSVTEKENAKRTIDAAENYSAVGYGKKAMVCFSNADWDGKFAIITRSTWVK